MNYSLSFTAASLRIHDTLLVCEAMFNENYEGLDEKIGKGKSATGRRIKKELVKRLERLTGNQLSFLLNAGLDDARKMALVSICKTYPYVYEFIVEVLREKLFLFDYHISDGEYRSFFNRKLELHPELEEISDTSAKKIRQVLFKILEEAKIIDSTHQKNLQPQFLSNKFKDLLREDDPMLLRIFFLNDSEIA